MEPQLVPADQRVLDASSTFKSWRRNNYGTEERIREASSWDMVDQTQYRGWKQDRGAVQRAIESGRYLHNINIIKRQVDTLAGGIVADVYEPQWTANSNEPPVFGETFSRLYKRDSKAGEWKGMEPKWMRAGFVYCGWKEYFKSYEKDPRGTVDCRYLEPDWVVRDPDWRTDNIDDARGFFTASFKSIKYIAENKRWMKKSTIRERVNQLRGLYAPGSPTTANYPINIPWDNSTEFLDNANGEYLVLNYYWMEDVEDEALYDSVKNVYLDHIPDDLREEYAANAQALGQKIAIVPRTRKVEKMLTAIPGISLSEPVEEGDYPLQAGRFHVVPIFMDHLNGHFHTIVDVLAPANQLINSRESSITAILETSSAQPKFIEKGVADDTEINALRAGLSRPGGTFIVNPGAGLGKKIWTMAKDAPPNDFANASKMMMDYAQNKMTPVVPAVLGQGAADESGILHQSRVRQALVGTIISRGFIEKAVTRSYNLYAEYARQVYTYPIELGSDDGIGPEIKLNLVGGILMEAIPRRDISVQESPTSATKREAFVQESVSLMQFAGPVTKMALVKSIITNDTRIPEDQKNEILSVASLEVEAGVTTLQANMATQKAQAAQAAGQAGTATQPPGGAPGAQAPAPAPTTGPTIL